MVAKLASRSAQTKLAAIVLLLLVPMLVLGYLMYAQARADIAFTKKEVVGAEYGGLLLPMALKIASNADAGQETRAFLNRGSELAASLGMLAQHEGLVAKLEDKAVPRLEKVKSAELAIIKAAEMSNLILDPVGESYYLAALISKELAGLSRIIAEAEDMASTETDFTMTEADRAKKFSFVVGRLETFTINSLAAAKGAERWSALPQDYAPLIQSLEHITHDTGAFTSTVLGIGSTHASVRAVSSQDMRALVEEIAGDVLGAIGPANQRLSALLNERASRLAFQLLAMLSVSAVACLIALGVAALMFGSTLKDLDKAEAAFAEASAARREAEAMSQQLQSVNDDVSKLNVELSENMRRLRDAQEEVIKRGRMAQMGQLVATVAHELRNPLGAVRTSAYLLERKIKGKVEGVQPQLDRISNGIIRCDTIITQLLDFARNKKLDLQERAFDDWVAGVVEEEAQKLPQSVAIECDLGLGDLKAKFDPARMSRVIINLMANAAEAMAGKGEMVVDTKPVNPTIWLVTQKTQRGIEIAIRDNGPGMPEQVKARIFEPLFTTKNFGTGLGLPAIEKVLQQHRGGIDVHTVPGKGTMLTAWFPADLSAAEAA
jgi:signal transduction histidine kinase